MEFGTVIDKLSWARKEAIKTKEMAEAVIDEYGDHLKDGVWEIHFTDKAWLIRVSSAGHAFFRAHFKHYKSELQWQTLIRAYIQNFLSKKWKYWCAGDEAHAFEADCVLFSRDGSAYFFDLASGVVEKKHNSNSKNGYLMLKDAGYWDIFLTPVISIEEKFTYERIIMRSKKLIDDKDRFKYIIEKYKEYFVAAQPVEQHTIGEIIAPYISFIPDYNTIFPLDLQKLLINYYILHGDFTWENTFFDKEGDMYVIDYELAGIMPFFQDLLYFATYKIGIWQEDWKILDDLMDASTEIGRAFEEILDLQGIPKRREVKLILSLLTRISFYARLIDEKFWSERNIVDIICNREKDMVKRIVSRYAK